MDILGKLFGSEARVKLMRLFLFNPNAGFSAGEAALRVKVTRSATRKELTLLKNAKLIAPKSVTTVTEKKRGKKIITRKKREAGFVLNESFPYLVQLQNLLIYTVLVKSDALARRINAVGKIKLIVISGVFLQYWDGRIDVLVVGDRIKDRAFLSVIKGLEAEIGKELRYALFSTQDFNYRLGMYDKLIRDILDYPHEIILNRIGLESR